MNFRRHQKGVETRLPQIMPLVSVFLLLFGLLAGGLAFAPRTHEVEIQLPGVLRGAKVEHFTGELSVFVASNGVLRVGRLVVTPDELLTRLQRLSHEMPDSSVLVRADRSTPLAQVLVVLDACQRAEIDRYRLLAVSEQQGQP